MKSKKFKLDANIYNFSTPLDEQISIWLENNPNFTILDMHYNQNEADIFYKENEE